MANVGCTKLANISPLGKANINQVWSTPEARDIHQGFLPVVRIQTSWPGEWEAQVKRKSSMPKPGLSPIKSRINILNT